MKQVIIGKTGKIVSGDEAGKFIKILKDPENIEGVLVITSRSCEFIPNTEEFDNWSLGISDLACYIKEAEWLIEWID